MTLFQLQHVHFFVKTAKDTDPVRQFGAPALGTGRYIDAFQFVRRTAHITARFGCSSLGNRHNNLKISMIMPRYRPKHHANQGVKERG